MIIIETINGVTYKIHVVNKRGYALTHQTPSGGWRSVAQNARSVRMMIDQRFRKQIAEYQASL